MTRTVEILEIPVGDWARRAAITGAVAGFLIGVVSLVVVFVSPDRFDAKVARIVFGYAAPITWAVVWGGFGAFGGAMIASTYNHIASIFGGIKVRCEVEDVDKPDA